MDSALFLVSYSKTTGQNLWIEHGGFLSTYFRQQRNDFVET